MSYFSTIPLRKSTRRYSEQTLEESVIQEVIKKSESFIKLTNAQIELVPLALNTAFSNKFKAVFGDYSKLLNAPFYIGFAVKKDNKDTLVNIGYIGEQLALHLTSINISSCWIATKNVVAFKNAFNLDDSLILPAMLAIGYPATDFQSKIVNKMLGKTSGKRKKIKKIVFKDSLKTPAKKSFLVSKNLHDIIEMARLSPSWHNVQPWKFIIKEETLYLIINVNFSRYKSSAVEERKFYHSIDMGIIMSHIKLCMQDAGMKCDWQLLNKKEAEKIQAELKMKAADGEVFASLKLENINV